MTSEPLIREPVETLMGWCSHNDQYHALCRVTQRSIFGVETKCSCPHHEGGATE